MIADLLRIGEVAERVGLSLRTVRYYEEMGLVAPEKRTDGGFRLYSEAQVDRLELIKHMKPLGFTVQQMCDLLEARDGNDAAAAARLAAFADDAARRCDELRDQLARAEAFAGTLREQLR
jgi:MerR family copper efflux transcriptional regulator